MINKIEVLQWRNEALTVKGQSLFSQIHAFVFYFLSDIMKSPNTGRLRYGTIFEKSGG